MSIQEGVVQKHMGGSKLGPFNPILHQNSNTLVSSPFTATSNPQFNQTSLKKGFHTVAVTPETDIPNISNINLKS